MIIFLDTELLLLLVHPKGGQEAKSLRQILKTQLLAGHELAVAEICDYEARRELIRREATAQIRNLDELISVNRYIPLDTSTMREAAHLWARLRQTGQPTASDPALDGDVILGAQALGHRDHIVATDNIKHLSRICTAMPWRDLDRLSAP